MSEPIITSAATENIEIFQRRFAQTAVRPRRPATVNPRHDEDRAPTKGYLSPRELRTVEKFAEVFIAGREEVLSPAEVANNIDRQLGRIESQRKRSVRLVLFLLEYLLPLLAFRRPFSKMSAESRKQFIEANLVHPATATKPSIFAWYHKLRERTLRDLSRVKFLFLAGYYSDARVYDSVNFTPVPERPRFREEKFQPLGRKRLEIYEPASDEIAAEICVIGSGAAGAVIACNAASAGKDVVLLEEGGYFNSAAMKHDEGEMTAMLYKEGGLLSTADLDMNILQGKCLGGSTVINNAICFRLPGLNAGESGDSALLEQWRKLGAQIQKYELQKAYARVERMINVQALQRDLASKNADLLLDGWQKLVEQGHVGKEFERGLFKKNFDRCLGCGYCNFGCPYERKLSMLETYIPAAIEQGARVVTDCHAVKIVTQGREAIGVQCEQRDGRKLFVRAQKIVLSCGAIGSSVLLMKSGVQRNVGQRLSFNAATPMLAKFSQPLNGFDGVQMGSYVDLNEFMLETVFYPPMGFAAMMPGWFEAHFERMRAYDRFACAIVLLGTTANARVKRSAFLRNVLGPVDYKMTASDFEKMKQGMVLLAKVFFAAGAEAVYPASFVDLEMQASRFKSDVDIERFIRENLRKPDDMILTSSHPQGGNIMSNDCSMGVVDSNFKVHGYNNLFVCDASVFPTSLGVNPQLTIMALADYACQTRMIY